MAYEQREYDQAISLLAPAIDGRPDFANALLLRGMCHDSKNHRKEATQDFENVARIAPSAAIWDRLGCRSYLIGKMSDAASQFEKAIQLDPHNAKLSM